MLNTTRFIRVLPVLLLSTTLVAACAVAPIAAPASPLSLPAETATTAGLLAYSGPGEAGDSDTSKCANLIVGGSPEATLVACDGTTKTTALSAGATQEWLQIETRFAPFVYETPTELLRFTGEGTTAGSAWQRALLTWACARHAELSSGKVSAAGNTVVSWDLGSVAGMDQSCKHLTVLAWGYGYAEIRPCSGGDVQELKAGWLETAELEQLDPWLYERIPLDVDDGYVAGTGNQPINDEELAAVSQWAADVWQRLYGAGTPVPVERPLPALGACVASAPGAQSYVDEAGGFCLIYPMDYVVEQTTPGTINIVLGSIMNHIDPRVSIEVADATGRTLEEAGDAIEADYAGFDAQRRAATVAGEKALVLDNLPGQDFNRRVALIHDGKLYTFFFTPLGNTDETRAKMDAFYQGIIDSFHFLDTATP